MNPKQIKKEAKQIMDDFMKELDKVKIKEQDFTLRREKNIRGKVEAEKDPEFRERMLNNAPKTKGDFILAEKKKW